MKTPSLEQFGLTESQLVSLEHKRGNYNAFVTRIGRLVKLAIAASAISAIVLYIGRGFDWPLFIPMLLIGAVFMSYLSPMVTEAIVNRLDPHSRLRKLRSNYQVESIAYQALWLSFYWDAFWRALSEGGDWKVWKERLPELPHSRLKDLPDPGGELFLMAGERYVLVMPRATEPVNQEFADRLLKTVTLSKAQKGIICSDEDISQEVRDVLKSKNIGILPTRLFLISRVLRLAILQVSFPVLERALNQGVFIFCDNELPFPPSMLRQAIAAELKECHDETLQAALGKLYVILDNFLSDEPGVQYGSLRESNGQVFRSLKDMREEGKPPLEMLKILLPLLQQLEEAVQKIDPAIEADMRERMKMRSEELEAFKEIAARNVKSDGG